MGYSREAMIEKIKENTKVNKTIEKRLLKADGKQVKNVYQKIKAIKDDADKKMKEELLSW